MDDVSEFFKSGFHSLHKNTIGKNYQQKTLKDRVSNFQNMRRETRYTLISQKRQIDENIMAISTPESSKDTKQIIGKKELKKPSKRLDMLHKWKIEKEKRKQEEKQKAKPLFKVCHVPVEVGLPDLENVNKKIKGKPMKSNLSVSHSQSRFAPPNHKFQAPKNIKPLQHTSLNNSRLNSNIQTKSKIELCKIKTTKTSDRNKQVIQMENTQPQRNTRATSRNLQVQVSKLNGTEDNKKSCNETDSNKRNPKSISSVQKVTAISKIESKNVKSNVRDSSRNIAKVEKQAPNLVVKNASGMKLNHSPLKKRKNVGDSSRNIAKVEKQSPNLVVKSASGMKLKHSSIKERKNEDTVIKTCRRTTRITRTAHIDNNRDEEKSPIIMHHNSKVKKSSNALKTPKKNKMYDIELSDIDTFMKDASEAENCKIFKEDEVNLKSKKSQKSVVKNVGWNMVEVVDDVFFAVDINKSPKAVTKKYQKTPRKGQKPNISDAELIQERNNNLKESNSPVTPKNIRKSDSRLRTSSSKTELEQMEEEKYLKKSSNSIIGSATGSASPDYPIDNDQTENSSFHTPLKNNTHGNDAPVYISPFVTISRGKTSARKEYHVRHSAGGLTPEFDVDISNNTSPKVGAEYFSKKLHDEINRIKGICATWINYKNSKKLPEEANDMIDVAIGMSELLISKKFQQFQKLVDQCRKCEYIERPITCEDLHGFWDMVYIQVEDLDKRFNNLNLLKMNDWQEVIPETRKPPVKRGRGRPKKASANTALKNLIKAARDMKKLNTEVENNLVFPQTNETKVFTGGYYSIKSPVRDLYEPNQRSGGTRRSLRVSLLANQTKMRLSSSPGLTLMKISQAIKCGDGITPSRSILKNDLTKSAKRITKSVLFNDNLNEDIEPNVVYTRKRSDDVKDLEDTVKVNKENDLNGINLITFSPITPTRRSKRLSKIN